MIVDTDLCFQINTVTREITNMTADKNVIMQFDHNSERFSFSMPRYVEGHDMSTCDKIEIHFINEDMARKEQIKDKYRVDDLKIDEEDSEKVKFSWLLSGNTSKFEGYLVFAVRFTCLGESNEIIYSWGTAILKTILVAKSMNNDEAIIQENPDVFERMKEELEAYIDEKADIALQGAFEAKEQAEAAAQKAEDALGGAVLEKDEAKAAAQRAQKAANDALENAGGMLFANALKGRESGEVVAITDISPAEHNLDVKVSSKNLANLNQTPFRINRANIIEQTNDTIKLETTMNGAKWTGVYYELPESLIGETLTLSGTWEMSNPNSQNVLCVQWVNDAGSTFGSMLGYLNVSGQSRTFTVSEKPEGATKLALIVYAVADSTNAVAGDTVTYKDIQLEKGTTATPYTPFVDVSTATLSTTGKNLFGGEFEIGGIASNGHNYNNPAQIRSNYINISCADYVLSQLDSTYKVSAVFFYDANETMIYISFATVTTISNTRIVGAKYARFRIARVDGAEITDEDLIKVKSAFQFEIGKAVTEYEPYIEPASYPISADGTVEDVKSIYPNTTLLTDTQGVLIECEYNKDINKVIENLTNAIISLGGNV